MIAYKGDFLFSKVVVPFTKHVFEMPLLRQRPIQSAYGVQKMRVPALQTLADASQMFRAVFLTCLFVEAMLGFAV